MLDYYIERERKVSMPVEFPPNRILPIEVVAPEEASPQASAPVASADIVLFDLQMGRSREAPKKRLRNSSHIL